MSPFGFQSHDQTEDHVIVRQGRRRLGERLGNKQRAMLYRLGELNALNDLRDNIRIQLDEKNCLNLVAYKNVSQMDTKLLGLMDQKMSIMLEGGKCAHSVLSQLPCGRRGTSWLASSGGNGVTGCARTPGAWAASGPR